VRAVHDDATDTLKSLSIAGEPVRDDGAYIVCLQGYHATNAEKNLGVALDSDGGASRVVATSAQDVFEEFLRNNQNADAKTEGRLVYE
jgi:hypothetical protein